MGNRRNQAKCTAPWAMARWRIAAAVPILFTVSAWLGSPAQAGGGGPASQTEIAQFKNYCKGNTAATGSLCDSLAAKLPTLNQLVIELAGLVPASPDQIRASAFQISQPQAFDAGKQDTSFYPPGSAFPFTGLPGQLGFVAGTGEATPTSVVNPAANSFFSAITTPATAPTMLDLTFDFRPRTTPTFASGQDVGDIRLPLVVADRSNGNPTDVTATVEIRGAGGTAVATDIRGNFLGSEETLPLSRLGIDSSLNFTNGYLEFNLDIPILITSDLRQIFLFSPSGSLLDANHNIGFGPLAAFLDASFADNAGVLLMAANADLVVAFEGSTVFSAPVPTAAPEPTTLALLGSGLVGLGVLRRRRGSGRQ